jgi:broad specificity phosphatase PhoE
VRTFYLITHPNVVISRDVPVPRWPLSELGKQRMRAGLRQPWIRDITAIYCSTEQKAIDGAAILGEHLSLPFHVVEALGENDRSATGFLPPDEFERVADEFFAAPEKSVRGWERAVDAQARMVRAVHEISEMDRTTGAVAIVSHGAVGTLLYCHLAGEPIARRWDQPPNGGGNYYSFTLSPRAVHSWWRAIDTSVVAP